jgi:hypothetical protein
MSTISATWKRSIRVREYETETLELSVEKNEDDELGGSDLVALARLLDKALAEAGDALVAERLQARAEGMQGVAGKTPPARPRPSVQLLAPKPQAPDDPDPLV